jgi:hypothetical protein
MMKTKITFLLFVIVMLCTVPLLAQEQGEGDSLFCVTIPAYKIYPHSKGYIFTYRKNSIEIGRLFLPYEWFWKKPGANEELGKGVLVTLRPGNTVWPHVSIFYRNGEFSYVKLYARRETSHESWGLSSSADGFDAAFENADPPVLEFGNQNNLP